MIENLHVFKLNSLPNLGETFSNIFFLCNITAYSLGKALFILSPREFSYVVELLWQQVGKLSYILLWVTGGLNTITDKNRELCLFNFGGGADEIVKYVTLLCNYRSKSEMCSLPYRIFQFSSTVEIVFQGN